MEDLQALFDRQRIHFISVVKKQGYRDRIEKLKKLEKWLLSHKDEIRKALYDDYKKPQPEADSTEIFPVLSEIRTCYKNLYEWMKPREVPAPLYLLGTSSKVHVEPKGVCLIQSPWNFPLMLTLGPLVSAVASGNCAILKPSEHSPHTSELIRKITADIFQPEEVITLTGDYTLSQRLLKLPFDHIFFTGSPEVGKIVMKAAAENLTSVTLELGGRNPAIVDETAHIKDTATRLAYGKFTNSGQSCVTPNYIFVHQSIHDKFIAACRESIQKTYGKTPDEIRKYAGYGRIVDARHFQRLTELLEDAKNKGALVEFGGETLANENFISPTLLSAVPEDARVRTEEIFGPLLSFIPYSDLNEVIRYINANEKPLALYVFSRNRANISKVLSETSSGGVCINDTSLHFLHTDLPFGGVNSSGMGSAHGHAGFLAFSNEKPVLRQKRGFNSISLIAPPYGRVSRFVLKVLLKWM